MSFEVCTVQKQDTSSAIKVLVLISKKKLEGVIRLLFGCVYINNGQSLGPLADSTFISQPTSKNRKLSQTDCNMKKRV